MFYIGNNKNVGRNYSKSVYNFSKCIIEQRVSKSTYKGYMVNRSN